MKHIWTCLAIISFLMMLMALYCLFTMSKKIDGISEAVSNLRIEEIK